MRRFAGKNLVSALVVAAGVAGGVPSTAQAASLALSGDGTWSDFFVIDGATSWLDDSSEALEFTYSSSTAFQLRVVDYFFPGDAVQVYANGSLLGDTPTVSFDDTLFAASPDSAFANAAWGKRVWTLGAGSYTFTGTPLAVPTGAAVMAISVAAVPEPAFAWLVFAGGVGLFAVRRRLN